MQAENDKKLGSLNLICSYGGSEQQGVFIVAEVSIFENGKIFSNGRYTLRINPEMPLQLWPRLGHRGILSSIDYFDNWKYFSGFNVFLSQLILLLQQEKQSRFYLIFEPIASNYQPVEVWIIEYAGQEKIEIDKVMTIAHKWLLWLKYAEYLPTTSGIYNKSTNFFVVDDETVLITLQDGTKFVLNK
ncbi:MAG: hypothetical protein HY606_08270 [Planctomycetes bacterium]|nr:hypothetical protein [Planctomycetota bacterium]